MKLHRVSLIATATTVLALLGALVVPASSLALGQYTSGDTGIDISYPSCKLGQKTTLTGYKFVVAGVSGGSTYTDNKCAAQEAAYAPTNYSLYVNTGLYTGGTNFRNAMMAGHCGSTDYACGAYEYGFLAGEHAYRYAVSQKLGTSATTWWLDVEETNTWTGPTPLNVASIQGEYDGLAAHLTAGNTIGIYSVPSQWSKIVGGNWPTTDHAYPVWAADGLRSSDASTISKYCQNSDYSVTGGPIYMVQYVVDYGTRTSLDHDYAC
jgi:hypothetical protein